MYAILSLTPQHMLHEQARQEFCLHFPVFVQWTLPRSTPVCEQIGLALYGIPAV